MTNLFPAAQAVDRAIADRIQLLGEIAPSRQVAAAALRAAAQLIAEDEMEHYAPDILRDIAAELEGSTSSEVL
jgi:hypothetical protein